MAEFLCYCWFCGRDSVVSSIIWHGQPSHSDEVSADVMVAGEYHTCSC
jgi:hypothetical protein